MQGNVDQIQNFGVVQKKNGIHVVKLHTKTHKNLKLYLYIWLCTGKKQVKVILLFGNAIFVILIDLRKNE